MNFFRTIKDSIYSPAFYRELFSKPASFSVKYFLLLALLASFVQAVPIAYRLVPEVQSFIRTVGDKVLAQYPDELVVTITKGEVSTNVKEPYFIPVPAEVKEEMKKNPGSSEANYENLVVFDTKQAFSEKEFEAYKTFALITRDSIVVSGKNGIRIERLDQAPDMKIAKTDIASLVERVAPLARVLGPILAVVVLFGLLVGSLFFFVYFLFGACVVWIIGKIKGMQIGYGTSYRITMHAITLPFLIGVLASMFGTGFGIPFLTTTILAIVTWVNLTPDTISISDSATPTPTLQ